MGDNIMQYNGGCCVAMSGKNCFAIASDLGMINQGKCISKNTSKVHCVHDRLWIGLSGLATDRETLMDKIRFRTNMYKLREERDINPEPFANMFSNMLYERRFGPWFVEPVIAGFNPDNSVFLCSTDLIGAKSHPEDFVCTGTCEESLMGMCEALWRPGLEAEELFEVTAQALLSALDRDCISGWGATVTVVTPDKAVTRILRTRAD
eukprot:PhM_4_TR8080/c0_g1_i1/m.5977/K02735/PSMB3; 20S proteasome subunit beta 3